MNAMQMISMEEWSVVVVRETVSNSREKERDCLARGMGNPPGYAPMHSRSGLLVLRSFYLDMIDNEKYQELSAKLTGDAVSRELNTYASSLGPYESISFRNAVKEAFIALNEKREEDFTLIMQWLKGENPPKNKLKDFKIFEKIDKSTAFKMIRSLVQWIREIGYSGLIVLMDEAEQTPSMSSKQKSLLLQNLRELIDECGHANFKLCGSMQCQMRIFLRGAHKFTKL